MATDHNFKVKNGLVVDGGEIYLQGVATPQIFFNGNADAGIDMAIKATPESLDFYEPEDGNKLHMRIIDDAGVNAVFGFRTGAGDGTLRLDGSGNLTNIGTISSGAITSTGAINTSGHIQQNNGYELRGKDTGGAARTLVRVNNANTAQFGWSGSGDVEFVGGGSYTPRIKIKNTTGNIEITEDLSVSGTISSGAITSSGNIVNDIGNSGDDSFIELKNTGYTGNITSLRQNADSTRAELNSSERSIFVQAGLSSSNSAEFRVYTNAVQAMKLDASQNATFAGTISSGAITSTGIITSADFFKATGQNIKFSAGGTHVLNMDVNRKIYPATNNSTDLGHSGTLAFRTLYLTNSIYHNTSQILDSSRNLQNIGTISSGAITSNGQSLFKGADTSSTAYASQFQNSVGTTLLRVRNDGVILIPSNYLYVQHSGGIYSTGSIKARGGITNDGGNNLSISSGGSDIEFNSKNFTSVGTISSGAISSGAITSTGRLSLDGAFVIDTDTGNQPLCINRLNSTSTTDSQSLRIHVNDSVAVFESEQDETDRYGGYLFTSKNSTNVQNRYQIEHTTGDSIWYNASSTAKMLWDASAERLGINTTTPATTLDVNGAIKSSVLATTIVDPGNPSPTSDELRVSGYGIIGNRSNLYVTNSNASGQIVFGISGAHNANPKLTLTTSSATFAGALSTGGVLTVNGGTPNVVANFISTDSVAGIKLQDNNGNVELSASGSTFRVQPSGSTPVFEIGSSGAITSTVTNTGDATLLTLHHDTGADLNTQKSFIDFSFEDDNTNETPQVRIGAEIGQNANADSQEKEGSGAFVVYTNNAESTSGAAGASLVERMRVDYRGYVGIGTAFPGVELDIKRTANAYPLRIGSQTGQGRAIVFADVAGTPTKYNWLVGSQYNIDNAFEITPSTAIGGYTFSNPGLLVSTSGNVFIGKTNNDLANAGLILRGSGEMLLTRAGDVANFNRTGSNGVVTYWRKDGAAVGDIGIEGGDSLYIQATGTTGSGLRFHPSGGTVEPVRNGATIHNTISLGSATRQFKDAYFQKVYVRHNTAQAGAVLEFSDEPGSWSQNGFITFRHVDTASYGSGAMFEIGTDQTNTSIVAQGKLYFSEGLYTKPASGTGIGTLRISSSGNATLGTITSSGVMNLTNTAVTGAIMGTNRSLGINAAEAQIHLVADNSGDWASNIVLTNGGASPRHYWIHNAPSTASANAGKFELRTSTTTTAAQIGGQGTGSSAILTVDTNGDLTSTGTNRAHRYLQTGSTGSNFYAAEFSRSGSSTTTPDIWGSSNTLVLGTSSSVEAIGLSGANATFYGSISSGNATMYKAGTNNVQTQVLCLGSDSTRPLLQFSESTATTIGSGMSLEYNGQGSGDTNFMTFNNVDGNSIFKVYSGGNVEASGNVEVTGTLQTNSNISINNSDGFVYLNNDGVGNAGIYIRGIGSSDTLRSHSTDNFRWEVLGSQKMELTSSGHLTVTGNLNGSIITGSSLNVEGLVKFGDVAGSPAADIYVYGTGNNYLRLRGTAANDFEIDLQGTSSVGNLVFNQFDLKTNNNIIIDGSSKYLIIENHAETDTGIIFNDGDASTGGNWNGSSSQAFKIQYHCGNETLIMGHDDNSYAGFNFGKGGALTCSGNITAYSDERLKENIQTLDGSKVLQMRGVSFTKEGKEGSGVIAQELEKVAPELVSDGEYKSVAYGNLVGYLIENAKQQQERIEKLEELVQLLTSEK